MYSVCSPFAEGDIWDTKLACVAIGYEQMLTKKIKVMVNRTVATVVDWSLKSCATGVFPSKGPFGEELVGWRKDRAGQALCGGWKAAYFGFRADMKANKEINEMTRSYQHNFICSQCMATKRKVNDGLNYQNFYHNAPYRLLQVSSNLSSLMHICPPQIRHSMTCPDEVTKPTSVGQIRALGARFKGGTYAPCSLTLCTCCTLASAAISMPRHLDAGLGAGIIHLDRRWKRT